MDRIMGCACLLSLAVVLLEASASQVAAAPLAKWKFESSQPTGAGPYTAESNTLGDTKTATASLIGAVGTGSLLAGNGSASAFGSQSWSVGSAYEFKLSTLGYQSISISFAQMSSATGPRDFALAYSTNKDTGFIQFGTYTLTSGSWSTPTMDLSSVAALTNQDTVFFRLVDQSTVSANGGTVGSTGTSRVDNFAVTASYYTDVPEPATDAGGILLLGVVAWRGWHRRSGATAWAWPD